MPTSRHTFLTGAALFCALLLGVAGCGGANPPAAGVPADAAAPPLAAPPGPRPVGLDGRLVVGYQGWFGCPDDFDGNSRWVHWFHGAPAVDTLLVDMLPATAGLADADLCETGLTRRDGSPLRLFSSQNAKVVDWHFGLMAEQAVGAVALQRFVVEIADPAHKRRVDNVLQHVVQAAQRHRTPYFLSYDVSGADPATVVRAIRDDWRALAARLDLGASGGYLNDRGKPVLQLWGFGFLHHPGDAAEVMLLLADLRAGNDGLRSVTLVGGIPSGWRHQEGDSKPGAAWLAVYLAYDVLSPWTVGRYADAPGAIQHDAQTVAPDLRLVHASGRRYLPVLFPGFSRHNLMMARGEPERAIVNEIPRACGNFIGLQAQLVLGRALDMAYIAMFDEYDEGTAMLPAATGQHSFPPDAQGVSLDQDGCPLAADWYLGVLGQIARHVRAGSVPTLPLR